MDSGANRLTVGDMDGDWAAEIVTLEDGGWWDYVDDTLNVFTVDPSDDEGMLAWMLEYTLDGFDVIYDLELADTNLDQEAELYLLAPDAEVYSLAYTSQGFQELDYVVYSPSVAPERIAVADHSGDAPVATLKSDAQTCSGRAIPLVTLILPPYDSTHSDGVSTVFYGDGSQTSESVTDTVSLGVGVDVGVSVGMEDVFDVKMSTSVSWKMSQSTTLTDTIYVANRYSLTADPEMYGPNYGGVVLAWGCFDAYVYEVDDPGNHLGGDGGKIVLTVPTGGGSSIWSTARYNAMAEVYDNLPVVSIPYTVGKVDSYPSDGETMEGVELTNSDLIFPEPQELRVSDVGKVCLLYTSPSPRDKRQSRMPSSA